MRLFLTYVLLLAPILLVGGEVPQEELRANYERLFLDASVAPSFEAYEQAVLGYDLLRERGEIEKDVLAIIDFTLASTEERLWVIDMVEGKVLYHTLVAHGKNSGDNYAKRFSNTPQSYQSSIGFYATSTTYQGKHGLSLRLQGMEPGINAKAWERAIVMHGADYVSQSFIDRVGRLGRSHGCPAVPVDVHEEVIDVLKERACLYIYFPDEDYFERSNILSPSSDRSTRGKA